MEEQRKAGEKDRACSETDGGRHGGKKGEVGGQRWKDGLKDSERQGGEGETGTHGEKKKGGE